MTPFSNRITRLFSIDYPIVQAGMIWASGWRLASAVSNSGGLGVIGAGSMYPDVLRAHIQKYKQASTRPFGVNLPLLYPDIDKHIVNFYQVALSYSDFEFIHYNQPQIQLYETS